MGVYIKGMEMPKSCAFCRIKRRNGKKMVCPLCGEEWDVHDPMSADHRLDNCPLVPVPSHGRLIDADEYIKDKCNSCDGWCNDCDCDCLNCVADHRCDFIIGLADAPTILEAEEER